MKFILGKKIEMTQLFNENGDVIPVTLVQAGPCAIIQVKKQDKDGYAAAQIGFDKKKKLSKALRGHLKGLGDFRWLREFRVNQEDSLEGLKRGDLITVEIFKVGDKVKVTGVSKGKGFQGVVKRHGFHGQQASHGTKDQVRAPGSIGATEPARVFPGMRMPGQMGNQQVTVKNLEIIKIDKEGNILYLKGAVPGARGSLVEISCPGELKVVVGKTQDTINKTQEKEGGAQVEAQAEMQSVAPKDSQEKDEAKEQTVQQSVKTEESSINTDKISQAENSNEADKDKQEGEKKEKKET